MIGFNSELIDKLESSHIARYMNDPYSDTALADSDRQWNNLGNFDMSNLPNEGCMPGKHLFWEGLGNLDYKFENPEIKKMHQIVENAAKIILPEEFRDKVKIYFDHMSANLTSGTNFTFEEPHIDGSFPLSKEDPQLRMFAVITNAVPTGIYKGSFSKEDFKKNQYGNQSNLLNHKVIDEKNLEIAELPLETLVLLSPSTVHFAQLAKNDIPIRHFLRWQLQY